MESPASILLRDASRVDCDLIAEVWWESSRTAGGAPMDHPSVNELRARLDGEVGGWAVTVAVENGRLVGFLALKPQDAVLDQLFVHPSAQRRGVGRALLAAAKAALPDGFTLRTSADNLKARRFYEREGLALASEGLHPRHGSPVCYYRWATPATPENRLGWKRTLCSGPSADTVAASISQR